MHSTPWLSALVAYAVAAGITHRPPEGSRARTEGWIHLPTTPLDHLRPTRALDQPRVRAREVRQAPSTEATLRVSR